MFNPQCEIYIFIIQLIVLFAKIHHNLCGVGQITALYQKFEGSYLMVSSYPFTLQKKSYKNLSIMEGTDFLT